MIYQALNNVATELNAHLVRKKRHGAILDSIINQDGSIPEASKNKIVLSLINLEQETNMRFNPIYIQSADQKDTKKLENVPYNFNLDVLVTAVNEVYHEGLKCLSEAIYFFQSKNSFTIDNTPNLDRNIQELNFELIKLSYHQEHSLWGALGAKYMPSVLFKVRLLSFQSGMLEEVPQISKIAPERDHDSISNIKHFSKN